MSNVLYAFRDRVSGLYSSPFLGSSKPEVISRFVRLAVKQGSNEPWAAFPSDHELYSVGTFDSENGCITASEKPVFVFAVSDILEV